MLSYTFLFITVIFKITTLSQNINDVCPYNVPECTCFDGILQCINVPNIPPLNKGKHVSTVHSVVLKGGNITSISKGNLPDRQEELHFLDLPLVDISDNAFEGSANTLLEIVFSGTNLKKLPTVLFSLNRMTDLTIADSPIQDWNITILQHIAVKLTSFELRNIGLSAWPNWIYFFRSLTVFRVAGNPIKNIPNDVLQSSQDTLQVVSFENSGLTELPRALSNLTGLKELDVSGNIIQEMDGRPGIEQLALYRCANTLVRLTINSIGLNIFPNLSKLHILYSLRSANNKISHISSNLIPQSVGMLYLQRNNFTVVPAAVTHLMNLYVLDLSNNQITEITFNLFPANLRTLFLNYNNIHQIKETPGTFNSSIISLYLQSNPISDIPVSAFKTLRFLSELYLDDTNLTEIPEAVTIFKLLIILSMTKLSLSCHCPYSDYLVLLFKQLKMFLRDKFCSNGIEIKRYLQFSTFCNSKPTNVTTQVTGMKDLETSTHLGGASTFLLNLICTFPSFIILLLSVRFYIFSHIPIFSV